MTLDALVPLLRCPACGGALALDRVPQPDPEAGDCGVLRCPCSADYPVLDGVPVLRTGTLDRRSIADDRVLAPGPSVAAVVSRVEAGEALGALVDLLSAPLCPWPLHKVAALRRLSLREPLRSAGLALRRRRVRAMLRSRDALTAEDWLASFYWHAPEVYDPFNYFFFRFGTPRHLATLGLASVLPDTASPVLDLACGYGHLAHTLSAQGRAVVGLDQNVHQAWLARHYVAPDATFVCADASRPLPFADGAFGAAVCSDAFHYVRDKRGAVAELDRTTDGGPLLFPTVGNALVGEPDGHELAPDAYRALFEGWHVRVTSDDALFRRYRDGLGPDLADPEPDGARWLALVATRHDPAPLLCDHGPLDGWPHAAGRLALNPLYEPEGDRYALRLPSPWYEAENGGLRDYMPPAVGRGAEPTPDLVARAAFVGLPERYARRRGPASSRPTGHFPRFSGGGGARDLSGISGRVPILPAASALDDGPSPADLRTMDPDHDPQDRPGLKQAELREAAHEGPHGSHDDGHAGPVERRDAHEHAGAADHGPAPGDGVDHAAMGHGTAASGAAGHAGMDHSKMDPSTMDHSSGGGGHHDHHAMMVEDFKRRFWVCLGLTVPILALSPMLQGWAGVEWRFPGDVWVLTLLATVVYLYGGKPFLSGARDELAKRRPGMMTLVALAITVAFVYSVAVVLGLDGNLFFWETATLVDLMLVGHWVEMRSVMGASRALEELARLMPDEAHRLTATGETEEVPTSALRPGDRILVKASEKVPADGTVLDGRSAVNQAALTGESVPVEKGEGDELIAGSVNGSGALTVEVTKTGADAYLNQVVTLVREAQASKSKTQDLANRAAFYLTITAITVGALTFLGWWLLSDGPLAFAIERAVTVMVIACPHALGLAIPLVVAVSTSISARNGLLVRDRAAFERARDLDTLVFDKTGTLTEGRFGVTEILPADGVDEADLLATAAAVEGGSEHPIAAGVVRSARDRGLALPDVQDFQAITGKGVRATVGGRTVQILSPGAVEASGVAFPDALRQSADRLGREGQTVVYVVEGEGTGARPLGALALADVVRPESKEAIDRLHELGLTAVMLTGDNQQVAEHVARQLGIDRVIAEVLPDGKSDVIRQLQAEGRVVAMTGDGVNDAPALATADVGLAVGAGTDVAVETADVVLVESDPRAAVRVIALARATYRKMVQNLWWAAGYNVVAIPLAAGVLAPWGVILSPAVGAVLMSLSTVVVAVNARRLSVD